MAGVAFLGIHRRCLPAVIYQNWRLQIPLILIDLPSSRGLCVPAGVCGYARIYFAWLSYAGPSRVHLSRGCWQQVCCCSGFWGYSIYQPYRFTDKCVELPSGTGCLARTSAKAHAKEMDALNKHLMEINKDVQMKSERV